MSGYRGGNTKTHVNCPSCGLFKPRHSGCSGLCGECHKLANKKWRSENREKATESSKKYRDSHKDEVSVQRAASRSSAEGRGKVLFQSAKRRAELKGIKFAISESWVIDKIKIGFCEASGLKFHLLAGIRSPQAPSIDKINPNLGYIEGNCRVVCWMFNAAKNRFSDADVLNFARALIAKQEPDSLSEKGRDRVGKSAAGMGPSARSPLDAQTGSRNAEYLAHEAGL